MSEYVHVHEHVDVDVYAYVYDHVYDYVKIVRGASFAGNNSTVETANVQDISEIN